MNKLEWHAKLLEWAESDPRLKRLPYAHIDALEEHLAEYEAACAICSNPTEGGRVICLSCANTQSG